MRRVITAVMMVACVAWCASANADERGPGGGRGGGGVNIGVGGGGDGGVNAHVGGNAGANVQHGNANAQQGSSVKVQANKPEVPNVQGNANADVKANAPKEGMQGAKADLGANVGERGRRGHPENLTDRDRESFRDSDDRSFRGVARENRWRYRRYGGDWWYWTPGGYWMFYRDGNWSRYNDDGTYQTYSEPTEATNAFNGPYYEDSNGFYYFDNGRRVYDSQIKRVR